MLPQDGERQSDSRMLRFSFYAVGIITTLIVYGLLQERIMTFPYDGVRFTLSLFLVFMNRIVGVLVALPMVGLRGESFKNKAPMWKYIIVSCASVLASTCQYEALKYVSFTVQILGKTFKMMPVMLWGMLISRRAYARMDWLIALGITGGTVMFALTGSIEAPTGKDNSVHGVVLLIAFLIFDGLTSTMQEKLFIDYDTSQFNQMLYVNLGSGIVSMALLCAHGGFYSGIAFSMQHPRFAVDALQLSGTAVTSQWFILSQVRDFGALVFAATINCRQVISILVSSFVYQHHVTILQWQGLAVVFLSLLFKSYLSLTADDQPSLKAADKMEESQRLMKGGKEKRSTSHIEEP